VSRRVKAAEVRFYVDADILGLAKVLVTLRPDVTYPGDPGGVVHKRRRPPCPIESPQAHDDVWIPEVAARGWLAITRDWHIQVREIDAVRDYGARLVSLVGTEAIGTFAQLEVLMCRWRDVLGCLDEQGPFIYAMSRTSFRSVSLLPQDH
jgi:hypothetical protein